MAAKVIHVDMLEQLADAFAELGTANTLPATSRSTQLSVPATEARSLTLSSLVANAHEAPLT